MKRYHIKSDWLAVAAVVFSILFAGIGLILGYFGVALYDKNSKGRLMSAIAICYSVCNLFAEFVINTILI